MAALAADLGYSRESIYDLMRADPTFPRPVRPLGPRGNLRFRSDQVEEWKRSLQSVEPRWGSGPRAKHEDPEEACR